MSVTPAVFRRLMKELNELRTNPPEGIRVVTNEDNMLDVTGIIEGPEGTPYAGGYFKVKFSFTSEFPAAPPKCWFATKIFHPNVSSAGEICVNTLKKDWQSSFGISHILVTVKCLLIYPNPESALDEEAGKLLLENYDSYCSRAKLITSVHATPAVRPPEFDTPSNSDSSSPSTSKSTKATPHPQPSVEFITTPTLTIPSTTATSKNTTSTPTQPLKASPSNTLPTTTSNDSLTTDGDKQKDRHPSPLGTADANIAGKAATNTTTKAMKRTAKDAAGANRKKALKRL